MNCATGVYLPRCILLDNPIMLPRCIQLRASNYIVAKRSDIFIDATIPVSCLWPFDCSAFSSLPE